MHAILQIFQILPQISPTQCCSTIFFLSKTSFHFLSFKLKISKIACFLGREKALFHPTLFQEKQNPQKGRLHVLPYN